MAVLVYFSGDWDVHTGHDLAFDPWINETAMRSIPFPAQDPARLPGERPGALPPGAAAQARGADAAQVRAQPQLPAGSLGRSGRAQCLPHAEKRNGAAGSAERV